jgi:hypothetical protein
MLVCPWTKQARVLLCVHCSTWWGTYVHAYTTCCLGQLVYTVCMPFLLGPRKLKSTSMISPWRQAIQLEIWRRNNIYHAASSGHSAWQLCLSIHRISICGHAWEVPFTCRDRAVCISLHQMVCLGTQQCPEVSLIYYLISSTLTNNSMFHENSSNSMMNGRGYFYYFLSHFNVGCF